MGGFSLGLTEALNEEVRRYIHVASHSTNYYLKVNLFNLTST